MNTELLKFPKLSFFQWFQTLIIFSLIIILNLWFGNLLINNLTSGLIYFLSFIIIFLILLKNTTVINFTLITAAFLIPLIPIGKLEGEFHGVSIYWNDLFFIILLLAQIIRNLSVDKKIWLGSPLDKFIFLFLAANLISIFKAPDKFAAISFMRGFTEYLILMYLIFVRCQNLPTLKKVITATLLGSAIVTMIGLGQQITGYHPGSLGVHASIGQENLLASYLIIVISLAFGIFYYSKSTKVKLVLGILLGLQLLVLLFSMSRGGWLAGAMVSLLFIFRIVQEKMRQPSALGWFFIFAVLIIISIIASYYLIPETFKVRIMSTFTNSESLKAQQPLSESAQGVEEYNISSTESRILYQKAAWEFFLESPFIGIGVGQFHLLLDERLGKHTWAHNFWLQILTETGIIGLISFLAIFILAFYYAVKKINSNQDPFLDGIRFGSAGAVFGIAIISLTDSCLINPQVGFYLWFLVRASYEFGFKKLPLIDQIQA